MTDADIEKLTAWARGRQAHHTLATMRQSPVAMRTDHLESAYDRVFALDNYWLFVAEHLGCERPSRGDVRSLNVISREAVREEWRLAEAHSNLLTPEPDVPQNLP